MTIVISAEIRKKAPRIVGSEGLMLGPRIYLGHARGILGVDELTMERWFYGWESGGVSYAPVITEPVPDPKWVSWFGFLHAYLMVELGMADGSVEDAVAMRTFFRLLADEFGLDSALGLEEVWSAESFDLIARLAGEAGLSEGLWMVTEGDDGTLCLSAGAKSLFDRIVFEGGCARRMVLDYPDVVGDEPIFLDALKGHGCPIMRYVGIRHLRSFIDAGDTEQDMLGDYKGWGLTLSELRHAVRYAREHDIDEPDWDEEYDAGEVISLVEEFVG